MYYSDSPVMVTAVVSHRGRSVGGPSSLGGRVNVTATGALFAWYASAVRASRVDLLVALRYE